MHKQKKITRTQGKAKDPLDDKSDENNRLYIDTKLHWMLKDKTIDKRELQTIIQIKKWLNKKLPTIKLKVKLYTKTQSNVLTLKIYWLVFSENIENNYPKADVLEATNTTLIAYGGTEIKQLGKTKIIRSQKRTHIRCTFYVIDSKGSAVLGLNS